LPCSVTLDNPLPPLKINNAGDPDPAGSFPEVLLSSIAEIEYEGIIDPTHPFSPRWDYILTDRDYSTPTMRWGGLEAGDLATVGVLVAAMDTYITDTENTVFCAGAKKADGETDSKKKADSTVQVDVLSFRKSAFERVLTKRVAYNWICKNLGNDPFGETQDAWFFVAPLSWCYDITGFSWVYPWIYATGKDCWDCYNLSGEVDDESEHPPCTANYIGEDLDMTGVMFGGGFNSFSLSAQCGTEMSKACADLRKPFTPINRLKMRYHNPDDPDDSAGDNVALKEGALEGMTFREYFGNHMPYPRIWDLGQTLQKTPGAGNDQPPLDTTGQHTAIVGIGREAAAKVASNAATADADGRMPDEKYKDQRCKTGGWSSATSFITPSDDDRVFPPVPINFAGVTVYAPDPISSWTEMKLYQARTLRNVGLNCIGRYEKVFKPGSSENMMLIATGGELQRLVIHKCDRQPNGLTSNCEYMSYEDYNTAGDPADTATVVYLKERVPEKWPNAWRGYMSAADPDESFPNLNQAAIALSFGLNNAQVNDIIMPPIGAGFGINKTLPKLALVVEANTGGDCDAKRNCFVKVLEADNGKWPDACGTTDTWGEMKHRYYFKPGHLPTAAQDEYTRISSISDCKENKISECEQNQWNTLRLYRIRSEERKGCENKDKAVECFQDS
jgi:hypothetical protein